MGPMGRGVENNHIFLCEQLTLYESGKMSPERDCASLKDTLAGPALKTEDVLPC